MNPSKKQRRATPNENPILIAPLHKFRIPSNRHFYFRSRHKWWGERSARAADETQRIQIYHEALSAKTISIQFSGGGLVFPPILLSYSRGGLAQKLSVTALAMATSNANNSNGSPAERRGWLPWSVFFGGLFLTILAAIAVARNEAAQREAAFLATTHQIQQNIRSRMDSYVSLLLAGAGLMATRENLTDKEFRAFVDRLQIQQFYPGVQGIGWTARLKPLELGPLTNRMRATIKKDFAIYPAHPRDEYHAILLLEPLDRRNLQALGYDMSTDPIRNAAMERARDFGFPAASGRVRLVQEIEGPEQPGFLIYVPVYAGGGVPAKMEDRRAKLQGFIYSPFRMGDLMDGIVGRAPTTRIRLEVYDKSINPDSLLHTLDTTGGNSRFDFMRWGFQTQSALQIAGREWVLQWRSAPMLLGGALGAPLALVSLVGLVLSISLYRLVLEEGKLRAASEQTAAALLEEQERLRQSEERFRLLVERAEEYAIVLLDPDGKISAWNPGAERIFGYKETEILGENFDVMYTEEDRRHRAPQDQLALSRERGQIVDERWQVRKDGSRFWATGTLISLRGGDLEQQGYAKILRDMTQRKQSEEAIRNLNQELEERVRARTAALRESNAQMEAFTYAVIHDLRAPLRSMHGFATALSEDHGDQLDPNARDFLSRIMGSARRMDQLIEDLLAFSRVSRADLQFAAVSLTPIVEAALKELDPIIQKTRAKITVDPLPSVYGHGQTIAIAIQNLLSNSLKFRRPDVPPEIRIYAERRGDVVRLSIEDNGIGIHPEHHERVFRVFERLHEYDTYPGTGMGLAIVKKGVERMGGRAGLWSEPTIGSTFWFEVPSAPSM